MNKIAVKAAIYSKDKQNILQVILKHRYLYLLVLPGISLMILFSYFPMYGIILAFKNYMYNKGILGSPWVGLEHFRFLFKNSEFINVFFNTLRISFWNLFWGFPAPIILALLLNELKTTWFRKITQNILYFPHFISWIVISGIVFNLFSSSIGVVNKVIASLGMEPAIIIGNPDVFRPLLYITNIWKGVGWGSIIFMAAIAGIDISLYESAIIDGAGRFKQCIHITIPSLKYAIFILLILDCGNLMNSNFDQIFNMMSSATRSVGDVIDTYVYRMGIVNARYDFTTAVGLFKQVINCIMLLLANWVVKKMGQEGFV